MRLRGLWLSEFLKAHSTLYRPAPRNTQRRLCYYPPMPMRFAILLLLTGIASAQEGPLPCTRPLVGATVKEPTELRSANGSLHVDFSLQSSVDVYGLRRYCYVYGEGIQSPALRVYPGDELVLKLKNELAVPGPESGDATHTHAGTGRPGPCGNGMITASSTNLHFHGLNIPPVCHQDEVISTLIQPGDEAFEYRIRIPVDEPPGLYWYHPHPHGFSEQQVLGGASGALIVEGIEHAAPMVAGLPERVLVLRDQLKAGVAEDSSKGDGDERYTPSLDLSLNYVPIKYPRYLPAVMLVPPAQREFWRVLNASADTFINLRLLYRATPDKPVAQPMQVIAIDGVPVGSDFASVERTSILLPPGSRAEFLMTTPAIGTSAQFLTQRYDNGPYGDTDSYRVLATIRSEADAPAAPGTVPPVLGTQAPQPFVGLTSLRPAQQRTLYFSERVQDPAHPKRNVSYFLTAGDATPKVFDMSFTTPDLTAVQGTVEDWTIENRAQESHAFHIHQLHFQLLERDGKPVKESVLRDTIDLPFWDGKPGAYPSVKIRMDFRNQSIVGTFLYHCHILEHEDGGMMGSIEVVRPSTGAQKRSRKTGPKR
jgi:FtsP/CotA-like multicopper oxidase with cupredoxin domain